MPLTGVKEVTPDWPTPSRVFDPRPLQKRYA